jgi:hypothetical protein
MSRRPGIAGDWFDKYKDDVYPSDTIHLSGQKSRHDNAGDGLNHHIHRSERNES